MARACVCCLVCAAIGTGMLLAGASTASAVSFVSAVPVSATEGQTFSGKVGTDSDCGPGVFTTVTVDWGDQSSSAATLTLIPGSAICTIDATHRYAEEGKYTTTVTATLATGAPEIATSTATVSDAPLTLTARTVAGAAATSTSGVLAMLADAGGLGPAAQYAVQIDWGDGHSSPGTVGAGGSVSGSHTYASAGVYSASVTVNDDGGQSASATSTVSITAPIPPACDATAPTAAPPFTPTLTNPDGRWVQAMYHDLLGRGADPAGLAALTGALAAGASREVVVAYLEGDPDRPIIIGALYNAYLHRPPAPSEVSFWTQFLAAGGTDEQVIAQLIASPEYQQARGGGTIPGFLGSLYCDLLRRAIDQPALASWAQALATGTTRREVTQTVLSSSEYRGDLVEGIYLRFLRRMPDQLEREEWVTALGTGLTDEQLIASLLVSQEYFHDFSGAGGTLITPSITSLGVIHVTLRHAATLELRVLELLPAVQRPRAAAGRPQLPAPRTRLLGTVTLGHHGTGPITIHWNRRIRGRRLKPGRYVLVLEARSGKKLRDVSNAITVKLH